MPVFGICSAQMLPLALGAKTIQDEHTRPPRRQPPGKDLADRQVDPSMNHASHVDSQSLPGNVWKPMCRIFDGSNCGIRN